MPSAALPPFFLVATDMDGTFLNDSHHVGERNQRAARAMLEAFTPSRGNKNNKNNNNGNGSDNASSEGTSLVAFALASGRHHQDLAPFLRSLHLPVRNSFIVSSNGARAHRLTHDASASASEGGESRLEEVFARPLPERVVYELLDLLETPQDREEINVNLYQGDRWRCSLDWTDQLEYSKYSGFVYELFSPAELRAQWEAHEAARGGSGGEAAAPSPLADVSKVFFGSDNTARLAELEEKMKALYGERVVVTMSSPYLREVTDAGVTKVSGLAALLPLLRAQATEAAEAASGEGEVGAGAAQLKAALQQQEWALEKVCLAFGDSDNDAAMLGAVRLGCLTKNAKAPFAERMLALNTAERLAAGQRVEVLPWTNDEDGVGRKIAEVFQLNLDE